MSDEIPTVNEEVDEFLVMPHTELREQVIKESGNYIPSFLIELDKATAAFEGLSNG